MQVKTYFQELAVISFWMALPDARGAKVNYRPELSADPMPGAPLRQRRGSPGGYSPLGCGARQVHILSGRGRRPGNGLGLLAEPAASAQSTAYVEHHVEDLPSSPTAGNDRVGAPCIAYVFAERGNAWLEANFFTGRE